MAVRGIAFLLLGLTLGGCMQTTLEPASEASFSPRDKKLLANTPYEKVAIPVAFQRCIVDYPRKELAGTIVVDTDARYLYYVMPEGKAIRYGVTVGEDAQSWSGIAKVGNMQEWPPWNPTDGERQRLLAPPARLAGGAAHPHGGPWHLSLSGQQGHAVPHPRHQPAGIYRRSHLVGMHPHDQRGRDRPL